MNLPMQLILLWLAIAFARCQPQLLNLSKQSQCIQSIVSSFVTSDGCHRLSEHSKSQLALEMAKCLFEKMGRKAISCEIQSECQLEGDSWSTFTTFYAHIDNLCHFYWDLAKAERAEEMTEMLIRSADSTQKTLEKNTKNTEQILQLQSALRIQIMQSIEGQQAMSQMVSNSSQSLSFLTSNISDSLSQIHKQIDSHYAIVTKILSAINRVLANLDALHMLLLVSTNSLQGMLFFVVLVLCILIGCLFSEKVRRRRNVCLALVCCGFFLECFLSGVIGFAISAQSLRYMTIALLGLIVATAQTPRESQAEIALLNQLNSERIERIMRRALRRQEGSGQKKQSDRI